METVERHVAVELGFGLCRGRTVVDMRRLLVPAEASAPVALKIDARSFVDLLLDRLGSFSREPSEAAGH